MADNIKLSNGDNIRFLWNGWVRTGKIVVIHISYSNNETTYIVETEKGESLSVNREDIISRVRDIKEPDNSGLLEWLTV